MTSIKSAVALAIAITATTLAAHADQVIHITGSSAFRKATVQAIENSMSGSYTVAYLASSSTNGGVTTDGDEKGAGAVIVKGTVTGTTGISYIKCDWTGSLGGVACNVKNLNISQVPGAHGWMSLTNLPAAGATTGGAITVGSRTLIAVASPSYALDTATFAGETQKTDVNMSDSLQASTPYGSPALTGPASTGTYGAGAVGVIVFEWVANNGSPTGLSNITDQLAQTVFTGGAYLSQFTGISTDGVPVYGVGRNFDSGTRLSQLTETGLGVLGTVQQMFVSLSAGASAGNGSITSWGLYPAETLFPGTSVQKSFGKGESGYANGGSVANIMATPGSSTVASDGSPIFGDGGWFVAYLGRSDANAAVKKTGTNTARRLTFNGVSDWPTATSSDAQITVYNDAAIQEGVYKAWEVEYMYYKTSFSGVPKQVMDKIATQIINTDASASGLKLSTMNVTKDFEGGLISHN